MRRHFLVALLTAGCVTAFRAELQPPPASTSAPAQKAAPLGAGSKLAVLDFKNFSKELKPEDVRYFTDVVRAAALKAAPTLQMMTRENLLVLLQASGTDLANCEGECEVDTGRRIGADGVVSGDILKVGSQYKLTLRLHETHEGQLLGAVVASGKSIDELDASTTNAAMELFGSGAGGKGVATGTSPQAPGVAMATAPPVDREAYENERFLVTHGTVFDKQSNLMWERRPPASDFTPQQAKYHCEGPPFERGLSLEGKGDWRLPSVEQLKTLVVQGRSPAIDPSAFPDTTKGYYWSSSGFFSPVALDFTDGHDESISGDIGQRVRCMRVGRR